MAPTPEESVAQDHVNNSVPRRKAGDEVVISGMSGIFPSSDNVKIFAENLFNKVDMVSPSTPRWESGNPELPSALGMVEGMNKFDAQFFRVHYKQGCTMEPMSRKLLEHAYGAIFDAGINMEDLRGKKVGVFIGSTFSESEKSVIYETIQRNGFGITGCNKAMYANRISYWIDGKGPSYALDVACASSLACLEHAYRSISSGQCDAAIVGGCNLCKHPRVSLNLNRAGFLCLDGKTKCFDKRGDGYVRSDAISVLFLQRARDAKRIYSEVYHAKANYSTRPNSQFLPIRESDDIKSFLEEFYSEIDVSPKEVEYVEAYGSGIAEADGNELEAIGQVFAGELRGAVKVGSVKSNMGHSEPASGVCSVTKICLSYEKGEIPSNLNYKYPQEHIPSVREGKVQVLEDHAQFDRGFVALNGFSYTGVNVHVLFKGHYKKKDVDRYQSSLPYLVPVSGRHEAAVSKIIKSLETSAVDAEQIALLHNIHRIEIAGHMSRGYTILSKDLNDATVCLSQHAEYFDGLKRPVWFMYSGMGSQWPGMGTDLMRIPIFAAAIEKCRVVLEPKGIDIVNILTNPDKSIFDNVLNSFVGIAAVQIGLTDILTSMGIKPDNIIGHSVGELGCAYADGCFTAEQMILAAYCRGTVSLQTNIITGSMAAVGLGYKTVLPLCPPEIEVACHNSSDSSTISGPAEVMKRFVSELTERGVFAKEVPCSNIPYHSRYIADAGPGLLKSLSEIVTDPKPRSARWVSTSVPQEKWAEPAASHSSAEYHTNNLLNSVLFEETCRLIPSSAIVVEISPHGLLQAIVKRSLPECRHVPLTRRGHTEPVRFLLEGIGKLYESGVNPDVSALYPRVEFPVSTGTPLLSNLVDWEHTEDWPESQYLNQRRITASIRTAVLSTHDDDYKYVNDHIRNGITVFPEAAILVLVWETLAMHRGVSYRELSVQFEELQFHGEAAIHPEHPLRLHVMIHRGDTTFEVSLDETEIVTGIIKELDKNVEIKNFAIDDEQEYEATLTTNDIYKIFYQRGHFYRGVFQSISSADTCRTRGHIAWRDDWVTFIDALIQLRAVATPHEGVMVPKLIKKLVINLPLHQSEKLITLQDGITCYRANLYDIYDVAQCGGVEISGLVFDKRPVTDETPDVVTTRQFVPHEPSETIDIETALSINLQIVQENIAQSNIKVTELFNKFTPSVESIVASVSEQISAAKFDVHSVTMEGYDYLGAFQRYLTINQTDLFIINNIIHDESKMLNLYRLLPNKSFALSLEQVNAKVQIRNKYFKIISVLKTQNQTLVLMKKTMTQAEDVIYLPITHDANFSWFPRVETLLKTKKVILVSERQPACGLLGLVRYLRKQYGYKIGLILIDDIQAPVFSPDINIFQEQLQKDLAFNILRQGSWGGMFSLPCAVSHRVTHASLTVRPRDLDSVSWAEAPPTPDTSDTHIVQVCYAGPTFRDVQKITGKTVVTDDLMLGMDFSGIDQRGCRVMGLVGGGSLSTSVAADPALLWPVPEQWTLQEAATVPLPYVHAYYLLTEMSELLPHYSVFVHGGAGALGQAVLSLALATQCQVYTTVSDNDKKRFLTSLFPELKAENIGNSGDTTFLSMVINNSNNKRCDIVINCSSGHIRKETMKCAGFTGIFLDLNQTDMMENSDFGMYYLGEEKTYKAVNLANIFTDTEAKKRLQHALAAGISRGAVRPLTSLVLPPSPGSPARRALRLVSRSAQRGRVLLALRDLHESGVHVVPRMSYLSGDSYVVVTTDGGFGIELADRVVSRGVRKLLLHIQPDAVDGYLHVKMASWQQLGVTVKLSSENLQSESVCANLLRAASTLGPVRGVFVCTGEGAREGGAGVTQEDLTARYRATTLVVANLDAASRNICSESCQFVVVSQSGAGGLSDVASLFADSSSERVCEQRAAAGFSALYYQIQLLDEFPKSTRAASPTRRQSPRATSPTRWQSSPRAASPTRRQSPHAASPTRRQSPRAALSALEASLKLAWNSVTSFNHQPCNRDYITTVARILGVKNLSEIPESMALSELRLSDVIVEEIRNVINEKTRMLHTTQKVKKFTIAHLHELLVDAGGEGAEGLGVFYTHIDADECAATEPLVAMPTQLTNDIEVESLDPKATYLMLIPGFEGHHQVFSLVCERVKTLAMTLQLGPDIQDDTIPEIAARIMKFIKKRFELKSNFYLLGYSFGVNVALELAALMEREGHVGTVFCLDSSPSQLVAQLDAHLGPARCGEPLQDALALHMYHLMSSSSSPACPASPASPASPEGTARLREALAGARHWHEKVDACVTLLRDKVHYSTQYKKSLLETALKRITMAREYRPTFKLASQIVLMRGVSLPSSPHDYNLSQYSSRPVRVYELPTPHAAAPRDCRLANIINTHLHPQLLEEFKNKNICDTYLPDSIKTF